MRIIRKPEEPQEFESSCKECGTVVALSASDLCCVYDQRDGNAVVWTCPTCNRDNWINSPPCAAEHDAPVGVAVTCPPHTFCLSASSGDVVCAQCGQTAHGLIAQAEERARQQLIIEGCLTCRGGAEYKEMSANLANVQARCAELLEEGRAQQRELGRLRVELDESVAMRDALGQKALQLQERVRDMEAAQGCLLLPGWACGACGTFNGSAKEVLRNCRACGARP
jgi:hypothetical protein